MIIAILVFVVLATLGIVSSIQDGKDVGTWIARSIAISFCLGLITLLIPIIVSDVAMPDSVFNYSLPETINPIPVDYEHDGTLKNLVYTGNSFYYIYEFKDGSLRGTSIPVNNSLELIYTDEEPARIEKYNPIGFKDWYRWFYGLPFVHHAYYKVYVQKPQSPTPTHQPCRLYHNSNPRPAPRGFLFSYHRKIPLFGGNFNSEGE